jgi:hypothetical protein
MVSWVGGLRFAIPPSGLWVARRESRSESFRPFVDALVRRAAAANPQIIFISGMPMALWVTWIAILAGLFIVAPLMIAVVFIEDTEKSAGFYATLAILIGLMLGFFPLLRLVRRNRPRRFDGSEGYQEG